MSAQPGMFPVTAAERYALCEPNGTSGRHRKASGQAATAEAEGKKWFEDTAFMFRAFLSTKQVGDVFAFEDFRAYADENGHPQPHSHKVWGSLPAFMKGQGIAIRMTDRTREAKSPRTRAHRVSLWEVLEQEEVAAL